MKDYSYEFDVYTNISSEREVPVYRDATAEEQQEARDMGFNFIPKKIKVGIDKEIYTLVEDAIYNRRIPDIRNIVICQHFTDEGKIAKDRFLIEEANGQKYIVKGKYKTFKKVLDTVNDKNQIKIGK